MQLKPGRLRASLFSVTLLVGNHILEYQESGGEHVSENCLKNWVIILAGGDAREYIVASELQKQGAQVSLLGFEQYPNQGEPPELPVKADAVICPLAGIDAGGYIYAPFAAQKLSLQHLEQWLDRGTLFLCGRIPEEHRKLLTQRGVRVVATAELDEIAIYNAIPTAEGALGIAMRESAVTIHGSRALVIGPGRCGLPLAKILQGIGARVTVAARRREALAMCHALGFSVLNMAEMQTAAACFDFIFNTVPAPVLDAAVIACVKPEAVIVDIASAPGGTDFEAAKKRGIRCFLAPGLPGKVAPVTAGRILAEVYPLILLEQGKGE